MLRGAIARRYAGAAFEIGLRDNSLDCWQADIQLIAEVFSNRKMSFFLREPKFEFKRKENAVHELLGKRLQMLALNFALLLVERNLVDLAQPIAREFTTMLNQYKNQAMAEVTTALPLDQHEQDEIGRSLKVATGKTIILQTKVDPGILGGVIAKVDDMLIDGSVRQRLEKLRQKLIQGEMAISEA